MDHLDAWFGHAFVVFVTKPPHFLVYTKKPRSKPQLALWCDFHKRWENHSTENCFKRIQHIQEKAIGNAPQAQMDGDKAIQCWIGNLCFLKPHLCKW